MKNIFILGFALLFLSACNNSDSKTAATGTSTPTCDGGGCGNGGGMAEDEFKDAAIQQDREAEEAELTMHLHIADNLNYSWKNSTNILIEDLEFFTTSKLLFSRIHTQNRNFYFYLYVEPQISDKTGTLTGVYKINLKRTEKAPSELTKSDLELMTKNLRYVYSQDPLPATTTIESRTSTREFWTTQKLGVAIVTEQEDSDTNSGVISTGPRNNVNFRNLMRVNCTSILIRGTAEDKTIDKLDGLAKQDESLSDSALIADFGPLSYLIEFRFNSANSDEVQDAGDISDKLED